MIAPESTAVRTYSGLPPGLPPLGRAALAYVAYFGAVGALFPYLPVYYDSIGLDLAAIGLLSALSAATQLVAAPVWGALNDTFPRSRLPVPLAGLTAAGGAAMLVSVRGDGPVALAVFVLSVGIAGIAPILDTRTLDMLGAQRARYGQIRAWGSASFVVVSWLTGLAIDRFGEPTLFAVYVPALVLTAMIGFTLPARPVVRRQINVWRGALGIVRSPSMRLFFVGALFVWTMLTAINTYYSIRIVSVGGANETVGVAWAIGAMVEVPIMFGFARLARRFGTERLLLLGAGLFAVRAAAAAVSGNAAALVAVAPIEGMAFGLFSVGAIGFVSSRAPVGLAATAQGVFAAVLGLASIGGAAFGGAVVAVVGVSGLFFVVAVGSIGAAVVVWFAIASTGRREAAGRHRDSTEGAAKALDRAPASAGPPNEPVDAPLAGTATEGAVDR